MSKIRTASLFLTVFALLFSAPMVYAADEKPDTLIKECAIVFEEIMQMPEKGIPQNLLNDAAGVAIFPSTIKGAFFLGGEVWGRGSPIQKQGY